MERQRLPYTKRSLGTAKASINFGTEGGRSLSQYLAEFGISAEDFEGMRVLDLGAGNKLKFARDLKYKGVKAKSIVSLSPAFEREFARRLAIFAGYSAVTSESDEASRMMVAGIGQALPFKDESFDRVVSLYAVDWLENRKELISFLKEASRVLAPNGIGYFASFDAPSQPKVARVTNAKRLENVLDNAVKLSWHFRDAQEVPGRGSSSYFLIMRKKSTEKQKTS